MAKLIATPNGDPPGSVQFEATARAKGGRLDLRQGKWTLSLPLPKPKGRERRPRGEFPATVHAWLGESETEWADVLTVDVWAEAKSASFQGKVGEVEGDFSALKREIARSEASQLGTNA